MKTPLCLSAILFSVSLCCFVCASVADQPDDVVNSLLNSSSSERIAARDALLAKHRTRMENLVNLLTSSSQKWRDKQRIEVNSPEFLAINIVGKMKYENAIPFLVHNITLRDTQFSLVSNQKNVHLNHFPCAIALSRIGVPAVEPLLKEIAAINDPSSTRFQLCCLALQLAIGKNLAEHALSDMATDGGGGLNVNAGIQAKKYVSMDTDRWEAHRCADFTIE